jgi:hypothetical protein
MLQICVGTRNATRFTNHNHGTTATAGLTAAAKPGEVSMIYQIRHAVRVLGIGCLFALLGCGDLSGASLWAQGGAPQKHKVLVCHIPQGNMGERA